MNYNCPNLSCQKLSPRNVVKDGTFRRKSDSRTIQRYRCKNCRSRFSRATYSLAKNQNKRRVNNDIYKLLSSGVSMRRCAKILNIHRDTVRRKLIYLGEKSRIENQKRLVTKRSKKVSNIQVDDLITIEHTKLKPLSITVAVDSCSREILGAEVSQIAAFGHLAGPSMKKYGKRKSDLFSGISTLFTSIKPIVDKEAIIETDKHPIYPNLIKHYFPCAEHIKYKGDKGAVVGYGELKKVKFDPLFTINHTMAMLRGNINRLLRRTWCTTKRPDRLQMHLEIFINYYNQDLLN